MGPLILGIALLLIDWLVALPYPIHIILLIAGVIALIYGLYILLVGYRGVGPGAPGAPPGRRMRWY